MREGRARLLYPIASVVALIGCGEAGSISRIQSTAPAAAPARDFAPPAGLVEATKEAGAPGAGTPAVPPRRIIYNAQVELVVDSVTKTADQLSRLIKDHGGYLSETDLLSDPRSQPQARWKVRVPVDHFDAFLAAVGRLGELQRNHVDSQDVTEEYVDIQARVSNKQEEEKRLVRHLADSTGKLEDILAVERELSRVRSEIEQMQGRIRFLANQAALSTVTIAATELKDYQPPISPNFGVQVVRTFRLSVARLADFGKNLTLVLVAVVPWLPVVLILMLFVRWLVRRRRGRAAGPSGGRPGPG
jgi:hypothetical protein